MATNSITARIRTAARRRAASAATWLRQLWCGLTTGHENLAHVHHRTWQCTRCSKRWEIQ